MIVNLGGGELYSGSQWLVTWSVLAAWAYCTFSSTVKFSILATANRLSKESKDTKGRNPLIKPLKNKTNTYQTFIQNYLKHYYTSISLEWWETESICHLCFYLVPQPCCAFPCLPAGLHTHFKIALSSLPVSTLLTETLLLRITA